VKFVYIAISSIATILALWLIFMFVSAKGANKVSIDKIEEFCAMKATLAAETERANQLDASCAESMKEVQGLRGNLLKAEEKIRELECSRLTSAEVEALRKELSEAIRARMGHVCPAPVVAPNSQELIELRATVTNQKLLLERARKDADASRIGATAWAGHKCASPVTTTVIVPGVDLTSPPTFGHISIRTLFPVDDRNFVDFDRHHLDWNHGDASAAYHKILKEAEKKKLAGHYCIDFVLPAQ
jgi:hypothetical protein